MFKWVVLGVIVWFYNKRNRCYRWSSSKEEREDRENTVSVCPHCGKFL